MPNNILGKWKRGGISQVIWEYFVDDKLGPIVSFVIVNPHADPYFFFFFWW